MLFQSLFSKLFDCSQTLTLHMYIFIHTHARARECSSRWIRGVRCLHSEEPSDMNTARLAIRQSLFSIPFSNLPQLSLRRADACFVRFILECSVWGELLKNNIVSLLPLTDNVWIIWDISNTEHVLWWQASLLCIDEPDYLGNVWPVFTKV